MKTVMFRITAVLVLCFAVAGVAFIFGDFPWLLPVTVTFGTMLYHFAMRLIVGYVIHGLFRNRMNYRRWWFRQRRFEPGLYRFLRVRKWKKRIPTFVPESFAIATASLEQTVGVTCQAEVVHEAIMILSFFPVAAIPWLGEAGVFWCTSILSAMIDSVFVILQRFNRPRLYRLFERERNHINAEKRENSAQSI